MTRFRTLPGLPPYGEPAIPFPPSFGRSGREGLVVEFVPDMPGAWVGNFRPGLGGYSGAHAHPNGRDVLVFSDGMAWVVRPETRECAALSTSMFGVHAVTNPPGFVCDVQGLAFFRLGPEGIVWHTRRISLDGFRDLRWTDTRLTGAGLDVDCKTWTTFEVDLATGRMEGGPYIPLP